MRHGHLPAVLIPLIHAPEMGVSEIESQFVYEPGHQWQLLCWPNRATHTNRVIGSRPTPCHDIFEGFSEIKVLKRFVEYDAKAGPRELFDRPRRQAGSIADDRRIEGCIVPPSWCDSA